MVGGGAARGGAALQVQATQILIALQKARQRVAHVLHIAGQPRQLRVQRHQAQRADAAQPVIAGVASRTLQRTNEALHLRRQAAHAVRQHGDDAFQRRAECAKLEGRLARVRPSLSST